MLGTLRFRLTALFLGVVLVFGLVSIALAVRLFQDVTHKQSVTELRREASGLAALYAESAIRSSDEGAKAPEFAAKKLELATGDELYYIGFFFFNDTATTEIYTLSLHDALPISVSSKMPRPIASTRRSWSVTSRP